MAPYKWPAAKPGSGGGSKQNAKAQSTVKQGYAKTPAKKPGMTGDKARARKGSPYSRKK